MTEETSVEKENEPMESAQEWRTHNIGQSEKVIREFIVDDSVPEDIKGLWWSLWGKDSILANFDETQARILRRRMNIMLEKWQQYMPYYKISPFMLTRIKQIQQAFDSRLSRAVGSTRERILLSKQTEEKRVITESNKEAGVGLGSKVKSLFGFGRGEY
jgi:hypothetical protein